MSVVFKDLRDRLLRLLVDGLLSCWFDLDIDSQYSLSKLLPYSDDDYTYIVDNHFKNGRGWVPVNDVTSTFNLTFDYRTYGRCPAGPVPPVVLRSLGV
jgi:hypothetical protein